MRVECWKIGGQQSVISDHVSGFWIGISFYFGEREEVFPSTLDPWLFSKFVEVFPLNIKT